MTSIIKWKDIWQEDLINIGGEGSKSIAVPYKVLVM